ncbi:hypothetical protein [Citreimonas salinaria]|uniref:Phage tail tube protein, TTP n=1 Tax=Citreimonas salinaria TaxID=321339 RepID=A0A1H3HRS3_9RHOB|nr:hypothetical protein [Citreimonas salinaria]SDY18231.1 hypothetical protein SAMN05444340_104129 [Citreimonas salinaria]
MPVFATAGAKIHIGGELAAQSADFAVADFSGVTWTEIMEVESLGSFGDTAQEVPFESLGYSRTRRMKGLRSAGTMEIVCGMDYADAGQLAAIAAEKTDKEYAFKITFDDAPTGGTPSERYFVAQVGAVTEQLDTANNVMKLNISLWVNSNIVRVAAAEPAV